MSATEPQWGITCEPKDFTNQCQVIFSKPETSDYLGQNYLFKRAKSLIYTPGSVDIDSLDKASKAMDMQLLVDDYLLNSNGVLGLSQASDFIDFTKRHFQHHKSEDEFVYSIVLNLDPKYTIKDVLESKKDGMFNGSSIVLNGANWVDFKPINSVSWVTSDSDSYTRWAVDQVDIVDGRNSIEYTGSTCFRLDSPYLLVLSDSHREPLEQLYNQYIC